MIIIKIAPEENGANANQSFSWEALSRLPKGWAMVSPKLEELARKALPWVTLEIQDGTITAISENTAAKDAWLETLAAQAQNEDETEVQE